MCKFWRNLNLYILFGYWWIVSFGPIYLQVWDYLNRFGVQVLAEFEFVCIISFEFGVDSVAGFG